MIVVEFVKMAHSIIETNDQHRLQKIHLEKHSEQIEIGQL
jgi:hypothetical protein